MSNNSMKTNLMRLISRATILLAAVLLGCAAQPEQDDRDAIADFIMVSELEPLDIVRFRDQFNYKQLTEDYVILRSRHDHYLLKFRRRCRELNRIEVTPDLRYDRNVLRAGIDTIRGCRIETMYAIDRAQADELEYIGEGP
jgi:hypothetical protein